MPENVFFVQLGVYTIYRIKTAHMTMELNYFDSKRTQLNGNLAYIQKL